MSQRHGLLGENPSVRRAERSGARRCLLALRDYLVAPQTATDDQHPSSRLAAAPSQAVPPAIAVVADRRDVATLAAAVALLTAARHRAPCGVVLLDGPALAGEAAPHTAPPGEEAPPPAHTQGAGRTLAAPAARRLAASLVARGLDAGAAARLVTAWLPGVGKLAAAERALAAGSSAGAVTVVAIGAPRAPELDRVLAACDLGLVVLRPGRESLLELAVDGVASVGIPARGAVARVRPMTRLLCTRGLAATPAMRAVLAPLLDGLESPRSAVWERGG